MAICRNVKRTGGTVFIVYRSDGKGEFPSEKGIGTIDGQAQTGEIDFAKGIGATLSWVDFTPGSRATLVPIQVVPAE